MYQALYRNFRPETFDALVGQGHIVKILQNQIRTGQTGHAYLFCGTRGTGKTSTARILAKGVNCLADPGHRPCGVCANCVSIQKGIFMDVIEIDAASNNGVDNVRELRESVKYPPASGRCKVYIIDEVHMLSSGAFNALLKTLEEPPSHVMFVLATTEVQKLPATILSRCLRLDFRRIPEKEMILSMKRICDEIGVEAEESALALIAANSDGSVRDGLSILDQCTSSGTKKIGRSDVADILGTAGEEAFIEMTEMILRSETAAALTLTDRIMADGKDPKQFLRDWIYHLRNLMMTKYVKNPEGILNMSMENIERIKAQGDETSIEFINNAIMELSRTAAEAKWSTQPRTLLELAIVRLSSPAMDQSSDAFGARIAALEKAVARGVLSGAVAASARPEKSPKAQAGATNERPADPNSRDIAAAAPKEPAAASGKEEPSAVKTEPSAAQNVPFADPHLAEPTPEMPHIDPASLWHNIFEDAEAEKGSFNLMRAGTRLKGIDHKHFYVEATSGLAAEFVERNRKALEKLVEKHLGKMLRMECSVLEEKKKHEEEKSIEEIAEEAQKRLGIAIDIIE